MPDPKSESPCGCKWERRPGLGDVATESCVAHEVDPVSITRTDIAMLAFGVARGRISIDDGLRQLGEMCTRHGPGLVRELDALYDKELAEQNFLVGNFDA